MGSTTTCDVAIVGAGLAGGLAALALKARHPALDVRVIDAAPFAGGNHLWSFFGSDVAAADRALLEPLIEHRWAGYEVAFPHHRRCIDASYHSVTSERLDRTLRDALPPAALLLGQAVAAVTAREVMLADGDRIEATGVIDARGPGDLATLELGWQKFVGHELALAAPHGAERPVVMDATVEQIDGYRFVYCLPFGANRMFVEDTYYSDAPDLDVPIIAERIGDYAAARGWTTEEVVRQETGVLPVAIDGDFEAYWRSSGEGVAKIGMRAGLFHPTTGYSLPDAVRSASALAARRDYTGAALHDATYRRSKQAWHERGFYRMLDAMLFRVAEPAERYRVLERFYRLSPALIGRFYAGRSTMRDKARILVGKPPVPFWPAVRLVAQRA